MKERWGKGEREALLQLLLRHLLIVWVLEKHSLTFEKLSEVLQGLLRFPLLTGISVLTAVVGWGQGKASTGSLWNMKNSPMCSLATFPFVLRVSTFLWGVLKVNGPLCCTIFRTDVAIVTESRSKFLFLCVGTLYTGLCWLKYYRAHRYRIGSLICLCIQVTSLKRIHLHLWPASIFHSSPRLAIYSWSRHQLSKGKTIRVMYSHTYGCISLLSSHLFYHDDVAMMNFTCGLAVTWSCWEFFIQLLSSCVTALRVLCIMHICVLVFVPHTYSHTRVKLYFCLRMCIIFIGWCDLANTKVCSCVCVYACFASLCINVCVGVWWHAVGPMPPFHPISWAQPLPVSALTLASGLEERESNSNLKNLLIKASLVEFDST